MALPTDVTSETCDIINGVNEAWTSVWLGVVCWAVLRRWRLVGKWESAAEFQFYRSELNLSKIILALD